MSIFRSEFFGRLAFALLVTIALTSIQARAAEIAGEAVGVRPSATLKNPEGRITLQVGMDVLMGDLIKTSNSGEVQLLFTDDTKLVVGPKSSLVVESYLLRSRNRANNFTVRTLGGTFRMITGKSNKTAYKIKTPTATIGVRGTTFDWAVWNRGRTDFFLYSGAARFCDEFNQCLNVTETCGVARAQRFRRARFLEDEGDLVESLARRFPYFVDDRRLNTPFRARARACSEDTISKVTSRAASPVTRGRAGSGYSTGIEERGEREAPEASGPPDDSDETGERPY